MSEVDKNYELALQRFFDDPNFQEMVDRLKFELFEEWQRSSKSDERDRIFAKLEVVEQTMNALRAAADSIAFEKQKQGLN
tara:strand:- start:4587 stop:4826 length:240 start_codon:yes stop_codon:yes gene_type:complete